MHVAAAYLLQLSGAAQAEGNSPGAGPPQVRLLLRVDDPKLECPSSEQLSDWVNQLAGRLYISPDAPDALLVIVERQVSGLLTAELFETAELSVSTTAPPDSTSDSGEATRSLLRRLQHESSCHELLRVTALSLAVLAVNDVPTPAPSAEIRAPDTTPRLPPRSSAATATNERLEALPGSAPAPQEKPRPATPPKAQTELNPDTGTKLRLRAYVGASFVLGLNPGAALGAAAGGMLSQGRWLARATGEYLVSGQVATRNAERVAGNSSALELALCWRPSEAWRACGVGGYDWLFAYGDGFAADREVTRATPTVGAELGISRQLTTHVALDFGATLLLPVAPIELGVLTPEPTTVWAMSPIAGRLRVGIAVP